MQFEIVTLPKIYHLQSFAKTSILLSTRKHVTFP